MIIKTITGIELYQSEAETMKECIQQAASAGVCLDNADFSNLDLEGISLVGQSLQWCSFENTNVSNSDIRACNLSNSNLRRATFFNAILKGAYMRDVDINGTNFSSSNLQSVDFRFNETREQTGAKTKVSNVLFINSNLHNSVFNRIEFYNCDFSNAIIKHSLLRYVCFTKSELSKTDFTDARMHKVTIEESILKKCIFRGVDLTRCEIYGCDLSNSDIGYTTIMLNCGFRNNKTSEIQRARVASLLYEWLEKAEGLSDFETKLMEFISGYASSARYNEVVSKTHGLQDEFESYIETIK